MRAFRALALICLLGLSGCSYGFDVQAVIIDGRLAFVPGPRGAKPDCVSRVMVRDEDAPVAATYDAWIRSAYAWADQGGYGCADRFPLFYGEALKGEDSAGAGISDEVAAKPLRAGVIYEVMITSGATGYGGGRFRLRSDGGVENLGPPMLTGEDTPLMTPSR